MSSRKFYAVEIIITLALTMLATTAIAASKRALIVTIGEYADGTDWDPIGSERDRPLMKLALSRHGFTEIAELNGPAADRDGIVQAIETELIARSGPGDVVVFHFSGHGQQITDDGRDELDGFDEALVPVDAPRRAVGGYRGEKHLRDDDLGKLLYDLRKKVGPTGDVLVFLDSCYSGTATRGDYAVAVRGTSETIGEARVDDGAERGTDVASGIFDSTARARGATPDAPEELSPMVVLSAETHNRLAEETTNEKGEDVGALSWALSKALSEASDQTSYRDLYESVKIFTAARNIPNNPQAESEGGLDRLLFAGKAVNQEPYFRVASLQIGEDDIDGIEGWADLEGGWLVGLLSGTVVEIHETGTRDPKPETLVAKGFVDTSTPAMSIVALTDIANADAQNGWAFVTEQAFGSLKIDVYVDAPDDASWKEKVVEALVRESNNSVKLIRLLTTRPDGLVSDDATKIVLVRQITTGPPSGRGITLEAWDTGLPLLDTPLRASSEFLATNLVQRIKRYALNSYLRGLHAKTPGMEIELELIPCRLQCNSQLRVCGGESCSCIEEGDPADLLDEGNDIRMSKGDGFGIRIKNTGSRPVFASVLDLMPNGDIGLLWPLPGLSEEDTLIKEGTSYRVPDPNNGDQLLAYRACPPYGTDMLKVVASVEAIDFGPIAFGFRTRGGVPSALDRAFQAAMQGTRGGQPSIAVGSVSTSSVTLTVDPPEE